MSAAEVSRMDAVAVGVADALTALRGRLAFGAVPEPHDFDPMDHQLVVNATAHPELTEDPTHWQPEVTP